MAESAVREMLPVVGSVGIRDHLNKSDICILSVGLDRMHQRLLREQVYGIGMLFSMVFGKW